MNVFVAGGSGAIGRQQVPLLTQAGHSNPKAKQALGGRPSSAYWRDGFKTLYASA
jgi:nucleoside-diphosphate-sugar epimerase